MNRTDFVRLGWATVVGAGAGNLRSAFAESLAIRHVPALPEHPQMAMSEPKSTGRSADFSLRIAPTMVELAPQVVISTIGYNNKVPGPLMRMREGQPVTVDVVNDTDARRANSRSLFCLLVQTGVVVFAVDTSNGRS